MIICVFLQPPKDAGGVLMKRDSFITVAFLRIYFYVYRSSHSLFYSSAMIYSFQIHKISVYICSSII